MQLLLARRQRVARVDDAADRTDRGDFRQRLGAVPAVDRERQCPPYPDIVERLLGVVDRHHAAAVPIALLKRDLVAEEFFSSSCAAGGTPRNSIAARSLRS